MTDASKQAIGLEKPVVFVDSDKILHRGKVVGLISDGHNTSYRVECDDGCVFEGMGQESLRPIGGKTETDFIPDGIGIGGSID